MAAVPGVRRSELGDALRACRSAFIGVGVMSCMINLLYLTGSIFMLEIYDRVLPSRSIPTLVGLVILAGGLYIAQGFLDLIRGRILGRIGTSLDEALNNRVFETVVRLPLAVRSPRQPQHRSARGRIRRHAALCGCGSRSRRGNLRQGGANVKPRRRYRAGIPVSR